MKHRHAPESGCCCCRREFLQTVGVAVGSMSVLATAGAAVAGDAADESNRSAPARKKQAAVVRGAFLYPDPESLKKAGYWSWPGSTFDPVARQRQYMERIGVMAEKLGMRILMEEKPLQDGAAAERFLADVKQNKPDGLLLIPFQKQHWQFVMQIVEKAELPTVVLATLGVVLSDHLRQLHRRPGVYSVSGADDLDAVEYGMRMIRTARWMKDARLVSIAGTGISESTVPHLGTQVRRIPHSRFVQIYQKMQATPEVQKLAEAYEKGAKQIVEPTKADILDAAKCYFVLKQIAREESADALMMECLSGLRLPHLHAPPCMGFMSLRDEGFPIGCQADLSATLTLMLVQQLFDKPGFQQNAAMNTAKNLYFGSHCTSPSKMHGPSGPAEPYHLRSHAEAGWGCVPRVLYASGQEVTMAQYLPEKKPRMYVYSGKIVDCPPIPPTGGCRSNLEMTINEVADVCDVKGMHQIIFYGNHARQLRAFCQMYGIAVET